MVNYPETLDQAAAMFLRISLDMNGEDFEVVCPIFNEFWGTDYTREELTRLWRHVDRRHLTNPDGSLLHFPDAFTAEQSVWLLNLAEPVMLSGVEPIQSIPVEEFNIAWKCNYTRLDIAGGWMKWLIKEIMEVGF